MTANPDRQEAALAADPGVPGDFATLEQTCLDEARWDELVELYRGRLADPSVEAASERAALHFRLGQILEERCLEIDKAIAEYTKAIHLDPGSGAALRQLRQVHTGREAWDLVLQIAEVEIGVLAEPFERAQFFAEMGQVWLRHIQDANEAMSCFQEALAIDPEQKDALAGLAQTLEAQGQHAAAAETWERLIGCVRGPDRATPLVALAGLLTGPLQQPERGAELYRRALSDDPQNETAIEALSVTAAARGQWELLSDLFERRFGLASGARRRTAIALEAGHMHLDQLDNAEAARLWFERARELSSEDPTVLGAFIELERHAGTEETRARAVEDAIEAAGADSPLSLLLEAGRLLTDLADDEQALHYLEMADAKSPEDPAVLQALVASYRNLLRYDDVAQTLDRIASLEGSDPTTRAAALVEVGEIQLHQLGDTAAAQDAYERAFSARPDDLGIAQVLEAVYRKTESWAPLRILLEKVCELGPSTERAAFHCSLGELLEQHFEEDEASARSYEAALALGPNPRALQGLTRLARRSNDPDAMARALEREAETGPEPRRLAEISFELSGYHQTRGDLEQALPWLERAVSIDADRRDFLERLADVQEGLSRSDELRDTLGRLEQQLEGPEQAAVQRRLAALHEQRGDADSAVRCWESALQTEPSEPEVLAALRRHYGESGRNQELVPILRRLVDLAHPDEQVDLLDELCTVLDERLCDLDAAIVVMWRLIDTPGHADDVATRLESLLERAGRFEELAQQLLERSRRLPADGDRAIELDLRRAQLLLDPLGQFEEAIAGFRSVRARTPDRPEATVGLERALRAGNDAEGLASLLAEMAEQVDDPSQRDRLRFERAVLLEDALDETDGAREAYASLCDSSASAATAALAGTRLERLLERQGDWASLRDRLESALAGCERGEELALRDRLATLCSQHLDDLEGCAQHLEAAGRLDPERADPWRRLAGVYQQLERPDDLLRVTEAELETRPDPEREGVLRARAAGLWTAKSEDAEEARPHYERLLELEPGRADATEFLVARYRADDQYEDVVRLLRRRLETVAQSEGSDLLGGLRQSLRLRIAEITAEKLDDPDGAIDVLLPALADGGPAGPASEPLAALYERTGRGESLAELCRQAAPACESTGERVAWLSRLGACLGSQGDVAGAATAYREILAERPDDLETHDALTDLYRRNGQSQALADLLQSSLPRLSPGEEVAARRELAGLLGDALGRPLDALTHLRRVIELEPDHDDAFRHALQLSAGLQRPEEQLELVDARLELRDDPKVRAELLEQRARLLGSLGSPEAAVEALREAIALDPGRRSARTSLRETLEELGRWTAVLDCLYVDADGVDPEERMAIFERAVEVATAHVGPDAALPWLERLRAARPDDPAVVARIADVHRMAGRFEAVLRALEDELEITTDPEHQRDLHVGRARILERDMGAPGRAIAALEAARGLAPGDAEILARLDELYQGAGRARERADVIEVRIGLESGDPLPLHLAAADLYADALADPSGAVPHLLRAVFLTRSLLGGVTDGPVSTPSERRDLLARLGTTLRAAGREAACARASEAELKLLRTELASDPPQDASDPRLARRLEIHRQLSWLYADALSSPATALGHMAAVLDLTAVGAGPELACDELDTIECAHLDLLRRDSNWMELERRLAARLDRGSGGHDEWLELGRLRDERLHGTQAALDAFREAVGARASSIPAIRGMRDTAERLGEWAEVARSLALELDATGDDPHPRAALQRRLGEVAWRRQGDLAAATRAFAEALASDPEDRVSLHLLQELHERQEQWDEAADLYEREAEALGEDESERAVAAWLTAARLAAAQLSDPERALRDYEAAAEISRLRAEDLRAQADLYREVDDAERFAEVFAAWCDDPAAGACCADHLSLVPVLTELERDDDALARSRRALEVDEDDPDAWTALATLQEDRDQPTAAADAWERAAELRHGPEAAASLVRAALLVEDLDAGESERRLRKAVELDAGSAPAQAHLARVAFALGHREDAEQAASRALDLAGADAECLDDDALRLETALIGGRAARAADRLDPAVRFFGAALEIEASHDEALEAYGELLFERGDLEAARDALEARLAGGPDERRAERLTLLGSSLELLGDDEGGLARFREAVEILPDCDAGHAGIARLCEKSGATDDAVAALERWSDASREAGDAHGCAAHLLRAAELLLVHERTEEAETRLRESLEASPDSCRAWVLRAEILSDAERTEEVVEVTAAALDQAAVRAVPDAVGRLALLRARALEGRDDPEGACEAYALAAEHDPRCAEAALARARLLRARGEWTDAGEALRRFCERHPEPDHRDLAEAHYKLARLLAGPLENLDGAIRCFERVLEIDPQHARAREPLGNMLAVMPDRAPEAIAHHATLLEEEPTRSASFRALQQIAVRREQPELSRFGLAVLRAIGSASPEERLAGPDFLPRAIAPAPALEDPIREIARRVVHQAEETLAAVLEAPPREPSPTTFAARMREAERDVGAPGLERLSDDELGELVCRLAALSLGDEGGAAPEPVHLDPAFVGRLDSSLGRWTRRKIRRVLDGTRLEQLAAIDFGAWRVQVRGLAAAVAVDAGSGDLRSALIALCQERSATASAADTGDWTARIHGAPVAAELLRRVAATWTTELAQQG